METEIEIVLRNCYDFLRLFTILLIEFFHDMTNIHKIYLPFKIYTVLIFIFKKIKLFHATYTIVFDETFAVVIASIFIFKSNINRVVMQVSQWILHLTTHEALRYYHCLLLSLIDSNIVQYVTYNICAFNC